MHRRLSIPLLLLASSMFASSTVAQSSPVCRTRDFEMLDGQVPPEGTEIDTQFAADLGLTFQLEAEGDPSPRIARPGSPMTAFESPFGVDTPAPDQNTGDAFLTDDGLVTTGVAPPLLVTFDSPADSASGVVLDIDAGESFTIEARGSGDAVLETITITSGDAGTGDALATPWAFKRSTPDVTSIRFSGTPVGSRRFGLGFDNFTTCVPGRGVSTESSVRRAQMRLLPATPNPFRDRTTISIELAISTTAEVKVFDVLGRERATLSSGQLAPGVHRIPWDASSWPSGVYIVRLRADGQAESIRAVLQR